MQLSSVWLSREMKTASADGTGESSHTSGEEKGCGHHGGGGGGGQHSPAAKSNKVPVHFNNCIFSSPIKDV